MGEPGDSGRGPTRDRSADTCSTRAGHPEGSGERGGGQASRLRASAWTLDSPRSRAGKKKGSLAEAHGLVCYCGSPATRRKHPGLRVGCARCIERVNRALEGDPDCEYMPGFGEDAMNARDVLASCGSRRQHWTELPLRSSWRTRLPCSKGASRTAS